MRRKKLRATRKGFFDQNETFKGVVLESGELLLLLFLNYDFLEIMLFRR